MNKDERRWHWVYTGEEFQFAEDIPFASVRYNHSWKRPEELRCTGTNSRKSC